MPALKERPRDPEAVAETSVREAMLRNRAFFVHTIQERKELRHNENSNIAKETTFEDDLDVLLAFEPGISASSVMPGADEGGNVSGIWSESGGVLVLGGSISAADRQDAGTISQGIRDRQAFESSRVSDATGIDAVVNAPRRARAGEFGGHNEFVIDSPEVGGYFKPGSRDEHGNFWARPWMRQDLDNLHEAYARNPDSSECRQLSEMFEANLNSYRERMKEVRSRGLPFYLMTEDRRFFEVRSVNDNGTVEVGEELRPEQAVAARAGIAPEARRQIGQRLIEQKKVFRNEKDYMEAQAIVDSL